MIHSVKQYRKTLSKELHCTGTVKKRLLEEFDKLLSNYMEDNPVPTIETLTAAFGTSKDMANTLMETVSAEEITAYQKHRIIKQIIYIILVTAVISFVAYVFLWMRKPLVMVDENKELSVNQLLFLQNIGG